MSGSMEVSHVAGGEVERRTFNEKYGKEGAEAVMSCQWRVRQDNDMAAYTINPVHFPIFHLAFTSG